MIWGWWYGWVLGWRLGRGVELAVVGVVVWGWQCGGAQVNVHGEARHEGVVREVQELGLVAPCELELVEG